MTAPGEHAHQDDGFLPVHISASTITGVWPPGCNGDGTTAPHGQRGRTGCLHHYGRNMAAEGCVCPAWFDSGGWHITERNRECRAHEPTERK